MVNVHSIVKKIEHPVVPNNNIQPGENLWTINRRKRLMRPVRGNKNWREDAMANKANRWTINRKTKRNNIANTRKNR